MLFDHRNPALIWNDNLKNSFICFPKSGKREVKKIKTEVNDRYG